MWITKVPCRQFAKGALKISGIGTPGASMQQYEIRILKADGSTATILAAVQLNDNAAIRSAKKIADGRLFEVWRGMNCLYGCSYASVSLTGGKTVA